MTALLQYANGVVRSIPVQDGQPVPSVFRIHEPEGVTFYFKHVDELPSGTQVFSETTEEEARAMWSGTE